MAARAAWGLVALESLIHVIPSTLCHHLTAVHARLESPYGFVDGGRQRPGSLWRLPRLRPNP